MKTRPAALTKSLNSADHARLRDLLIEARNNAGLTQRDVAVLLRKPQSFVAKYEIGERRLDVIEFVAVTRAMGTDPVRLLKALLR